MPPRRQQQWVFHGNVLSSNDSLLQLNVNDSAVITLILGEELLPTMGRCRAQFEGADYGPEYLILNQGDQVDLEDHPLADGDWSFGRAHGVRGWFPTQLWEPQ
eukprot:gnl/MRDRNA2_/MRDRNA2_288297_c0_seq1.p1 gnl/MRDRNA2_/MRDRNA2_288297_c0~~gnl/MRDRNA2_/MRDRNA2_288297_c0_seq1.p1  ORF type:complete len:103 (-),score=16.65 gnl/MRDRNA2_/MRDRNA2_288297_c0_seq1:44-352(-)